LCNKIRPTGSYTRMKPNEISNLQANDTPTEVTVH